MDCTDEELQSYFTWYGSVLGAYVLKDDQYVSRGCAWVYMEDVKVAENIVKQKVHAVGEAKNHPDANDGMNLHELAAPHMPQRSGERIHVKTVAERRQQEKRSVNHKAKLDAKRDRHKKNKASGLIGGVIDPDDL